MKIESSKGKQHEIELISEIGNGKQVLIAFYDERPMSEIAADFENCSELVAYNTRQPNVKKVYGGYTRLVSMQRMEMSGMVRVILAHP